ncbi:MAG: tRNA lysidine(34) synthetase TilS, partial [Gammaproteobacteria bacterium]|nr:tRNA lysidine(34) synthetase TilS [Gammaproteobacteria bacterium]
MADPTVDGPLAAVDAAIGQIETDLQGRIHLSVQGLEQYATQGPIQRPIQLGPQKKLWVAFSGGLDSTVLLDAAWRAYGEGVRAIHVNHQLQHEAARWETHCRAFADARGITLTVRRVTVGRGNLEAEARRARYDVWRELLPRGQVLLVAHHGNDQAETVLWKLFTGRHPSGMPKLRKLGSGWLLRPFLALHREAICAYARHRGLQWVEDPMNDDESYARIYIRKRVLPAVVARYPGFIDSLCSDSYTSETSETSDTSDTSAFASDASDASDRFDQSAAGDADPLAPGVQEEPGVQQEPGAHRGPLAVADASPASLRDWLGIGVGDRLIAEIGRQAGARRDADPVVRLPNGLQVR